MLRRRRGFTLIELLVVIAIIGILAAMLFPVFARARESARKIQCLSNVKNIALAAQMYLTDYDRFWPSEQNAQFWDTINAESGKDSDCRGSIGDRFNPYLREPVLLDEYIKNRDVWRCPSAIYMLAAQTIVPGYESHYDWWLKNGGWGPTGGWALPWAACANPYPSGWGGAVTDSAVQQTTATQSAGVFGGEGVFAAGYAMNGSLRDMSPGQMEDPAKYIVLGDRGNQTYVLWNTALLAWPDVCAVYKCGWCDAGCVGTCAPDWENCPQSQDCSLVNKNQAYQFLTDAQFRSHYTRHLGGSNIGFGDGHAAWWSSDAIIAASSPQSDPPGLLGMDSYWPAAKPGCPPTPHP